MGLYTYTQAEIDEGIRRWSKIADIERQRMEEAEEQVELWKSRTAGVPDPPSES